MMFRDLQFNMSIVNIKRQKTRTNLVIGNNKVKYVSLE